MSDAKLLLCSSLASRDRKTPATAPVSIGSPSDVPVPCASNETASSGSSCASSIADISTLCCAWPFGAVKLALRPSWRTALPWKPILAEPRWQTIALIASPRAYPSARTSKVYDRPFTDVKPATALPLMMVGLRIMFTPALSAASLSRRCKPRMLVWLATSDAEQAVSNVAQGPCSPRENDTRPQVTEHAKPVDAYTLRPAGMRAMTLSNSLAHWPTLTATTAPRSARLDILALCSATYPRSSSCRCCGSIAAASAAETPKQLCSNSSASCKKPPWRTRLATSGGLPLRSSAASSTSHREAGMMRSRLQPH
eukprot:6015864-Prymnesium_polylepis.1